MELNPRSPPTITFSQKRRIKPKSQNHFRRQTRPQTATKQPQASKHKNKATLYRNKGQTPTTTSTLPHLQLRIIIKLFTTNRTPHSNAPQTKQQPNSGINKIFPKQQYAKQKTSKTQ
jgi:hypothetical protein